MKLRSRYVRLPTCSPPVLLRAALRPARRPPPWPQLTAGHGVLTHRARTGLALLCDAWQLQAGDRVLLPAYNCGSEVDPFLNRGLDVQLYRVGRDARIDLEDLRRRINGRTRIVHVTHYFGWPQKLDELHRLCREHDIYLVEDCALSLFSQAPAGWIGTSGDAAVFSFTKTLGVPDGGALIVREPLAFAHLQAPGARPVLRGLLSLCKRYACTWAAGLGWSPSDQRAAAAVADLQPRGSNAYPDMPADYYFRQEVGRWRCSRVTRGLLRFVEPEAVIARRRANYEDLLVGIQDVSQLQPLMPTLSAGVCPLMLPVVAAARNEWVRELTRVGIPAIPWWGGYHRELPWGEFPDACYLKDHVMALPVHPDLKRHEIDHIIAAVRAVAVRLAPLADSSTAPLPASGVACSSVSPAKGVTA